MSGPRFHGTALFAALLLAAGAAQAQSEGVTAPTFAGGASAITEVHGDWTVVCGSVEETLACLITQSLSDNQSGQRVLSIELASVEGGGVEGTLVVPFGLRLSDGIRIQIDAVASGAAQPFAVCYDYGCLVDLSFDAPSVDLLKRGTTLRLTGVIDDNGENIAFSAPLKGIASALARSAALSAR